MSETLPPAVRRIIELALAEDLGGGDVTTRLTVPNPERASGRVIAREELVVSGGDVFEAVMALVDPEIRVHRLVDDGSLVSAGASLIEVDGPVDGVLAGERVALNFLMRLSGVATLTRRFVEQLPEGSAARITDTRKTTPGLRFLERRAVRHGGGHNHRDDLGGGVLIKENHIAAAGSVGEAVRRCREGAPHPLRVEVEVERRDQLREALAAGAEAVLLDNMDLEEVQRCAAEARAAGVLAEVSGGVSLERVADLARAGADVISVGALTHSAPAADLSLLIERG